MEVLQLLKDNRLEGETKKTFLFYCLKEKNKHKRKKGKEEEEEKKHQKGWSNHFLRLQQKHVGVGSSSLVP